jgi:antitoxin (DNA-binding transcriptional repressor) of toxin-antitoxin stability system
VPKTVSKPEFARRALAYLREVEQTGEPPILTDRGRAVLRVVPQATAHDVLATLHGCVVRYDDPTQPVAIEAWGAGAWRSTRQAPAPRPRQRPLTPRFANNPRTTSSGSASTTRPR